MGWTYLGAYIGVGVAIVALSLRELLRRGEITTPEDACCATMLAVVCGAGWPVTLPIVLVMFAVWMSAVKRKEAHG